MFFNNQLFCIKLSKHAKWSILLTKFMINPISNLLKPTLIQDLIYTLLFNYQWKAWVIILKDTNQIKTESIRLKYIQ